MKLLSVLVVDDDAVDRQLIAQAFADAGVDIQLHFAASAGEALKMLTESGKAEDQACPDVCIFDINMPGVSGIDLLQKVKVHSSLRKIPIVMLSSSDDRKDIAKCYELQASGYIRKPDNYGELKELVAGVTRFWHNTVSFPNRIQTLGLRSS